MSLSAYELLQHINDEVDYLLDNSKSLSFQDFINDQTLIRAYARSLEIIGEATKKLPKNFTKKYPDIEWRSMAGLRDKLIHNYFGVDFELVWDVVINKLPQLKIQINIIFKDFQ